MPLYQYACGSCAGVIERRQGFEESPLVECPQCGGRLQRVLQPVGLIFKGSGWYCTDNRSKETGCKADCDPDKGVCGAKQAVA